MLSTTTPSQPSSHRRGHAHKRSAAISGDFDVIGMDFFKAPPNQKVVQSSSSLPKDSFMSPKLSAPQLPTAHAPSFVITDVTESSSSSQKLQDSNPQKHKPRRSSKEKKKSSAMNDNNTDELTTSTPSPQKKHTRLNSWAHSFIKPKKSEPQQTLAIKDYNSSSSNEATPDKSSQFTYTNNNNNNNNVNSQKTKTPYYDVPEALIDLDLASGILHDPNSKIPRKKMIHRRTESAPELEDFLKYKVFSHGQNGNGGNNTQQKNPAIFEEDEEDDFNEIDEDALSSASSNNNIPNVHTIKNKNGSTNSLNSYPSFKLQSPATVNNSIVSTPTSVKTNATQQSQSTRRNGGGGGATAARYQSYYNNSLLLSNALKSSESLSQITNSQLQNKTSFSSFNSKSMNLLSSNSSINSSNVNCSPSRFKFESKVYDPPSQNEQCFAPSAISNSPTSSTSSSLKKDQPNVVTSPTKSSKKLYLHKKSNSLLSSINLKIRRNSITKHSDSDKENENYSNDDDGDDDDDDKDIGDSTITPFNFGEPGPELDLTTMTPKIINSRTSSSNNTPASKRQPFYYGVDFNDDNDDNDFYNNSKSKTTTTDNNRNNDNTITTATTTHNTFMNDDLKSPKRHGHVHGHKKFFNWLKK